jgi:hypothetical protein
MFKRFLETMLYGDINQVDNASLKEMINEAFKRKEIPQPFLSLKDASDVVEHFSTLVDKYGEDVIIKYYLPRAS